MGWLWPFGSRRENVPKVTAGTRAVLGFRKFSGHPVFELSEKYVFVQLVNPKKDSRLHSDIAFGNIIAKKVGAIIYFLEPVTRELTEHAICLLGWSDKFQTYTYHDRPLRKTDVITVNGYEMTYHLMSGE